MDPLILVVLTYLVMGITTLVVDPILDKRLKKTNARLALVGINLTIFISTITYLIMQS